jgi:hypothetical protein
MLFHHETATGCVLTPRSLTCGRGGVVFQRFNLTNVFTSTLFKYSSLLMDLVYRRKSPHFKGRFGTEGNLF